MEQGHLHCLDFCNFYCNTASTQFAMICYSEGSWKVHDLDRYHTLVKVLLDASVHTAYLPLCSKSKVCAHEKNNYSNVSISCGNGMFNLTGKWKAR